jgi:hypothetical protein
MAEVKMSNLNLCETKTQWISLEVNEEDGESLKLKLLAAGKDFFSKGSAYISLDQLKIFFNEISLFPLNKTSHPLLSGGFYDNNNMLTEYIHISVYQLNRTGLLVMKVKTFTPHLVFFNDEGDLGFGGMYDYYLQYESLREFANKLLLIVEGKSKLIEFCNFELVE